MLSRPYSCILQRGEFPVTSVARTHRRRAVNLFTAVLWASDKSVLTCFSAATILSVSVSPPHRSRPAVPPRRQRRKIRPTSHLRLLFITMHECRLHRHRRRVNSQFDTCHAYCLSITHRINDAQHALVTHATHIFNIHPPLCLFLFFFPSRRRICVSSCASDIRQPPRT